MILASITCYPGGATVFREWSSSNFSTYFFYFYKCLIIPTVSKYPLILYATTAKTGYSKRNVLVGASRFRRCSPRLRKTNANEVTCMSQIESTYVPVTTRNASVRTRATHCARITRAVVCLRGGFCFNNRATT